MNKYHSHTSECVDIWTNGFPGTQARSGSDHPATCTHTFTGWEHD